MTWHLAAYTGSIAGTANTDLPALSDDILTINNGHFLLRQQMSLIGAYALGNLLLRARFDSPTLRFFGNPFIRPLDTGTTPPANYNLMEIADHPFVLPAGEEIAIQVSNSGAGPTRTQALVALSPGIEMVNPGNIYAVRGTSTTAAVANAWTTLAYTLDTGLPTGQFEMIFSEIFSTTMIAHRWIFDEQVHRPGFISTPVVTSRMFSDIYNYPWGLMGRFVNTSLPRLQVLAGAADASFEFYIFLRSMGR